MRFQLVFKPKATRMQSLTPLMHSRARSLMQKAMGDYFTTSNDERDGGVVFCLIGNVCCRRIKTRDHMRRGRPFYVGVITIRVWGHSGWTMDHNRWEWLTVTLRFVTKGDFDESLLPTKRQPVNRYFRMKILPPSIQVPLPDLFEFRINRRVSYHLLIQLGFR